MYTIAHCNEMISHYAAQSVNTDKPANWRALARVSAAEWQFKLEQAKRA